MEEQKLLRFPIIKKNIYVAKLYRLTKLKRKIRTVLRRFKGIKNSRTLKRLFVALLKHLENKYKSQDKLRGAYKFHLNFLRSYVLHRFFLLRRNRIAREYILNKKYKLLLFNLSKMKTATIKFKVLVSKSDRLFMKKGFRRLKQVILLGKKAPKKKYISRKMTATQNAKLDKWRTRY